MKENNFSKWFVLIVLAALILLPVGNAFAYNGVQSVGIKGQWHREVAVEVPAATFAAPSGSLTYEIRRLTSTMADPGGAPTGNMVEGNQQFDRYAVVDGTIYLGLDTGLPLQPAEGQLPLDEEWISVGMLTEFSSDLIIKNLPHIFWGPNNYPGRDRMVCTWMRTVDQPIAIGEGSTTATLTGDVLDASQKRQHSMKVDVPLDRLDIETTGDQTVVLINGFRTEITDPYNHAGVEFNVLGGTLTLTGTSNLDLLGTETTWTSIEIPCP